MFEEFIKFYGDTPEIPNKLYTWRINSIMDLEARLKYWSQRVYIRAAWYVLKENGKVTQCSRIDLDMYFNYQEVQFKQEKNL
jgi:hypothetical protein